MRKSAFTVVLFLYITRKLLYNLTNNQHKGKQMDIKQVLAQNNFRFNKQFGQNFLADSYILDSIVSDSHSQGEAVLEIGAGAGTLTRALSKTASKVTSFEIDRNLQKVLQTTLAGCDNVQMVFGDVMKYKTAEIESMVGEPYHVVANIPYYITTPLIMKFVEEGTKVLSLTLTIQKEVALRLTAKPKTKDYGAITVGVDAVADCTLTRILGRELFYPVPNVDSAVVHIAMHPNKYDIGDADLFRKTVKVAFATRRKTLVNNLMNGFGFTRECAEKVLTCCNFSVTVRGEELSTADFVTLSQQIAKVLKNDQH